LRPTFDPPQPWYVPIAGYGPSAPLEGAGGRITLTSILVTPSKVWVGPLQSRTLPLAGWTLQVTSPPKTLGISA
jgi:hypothetical protein